MLYEISLFNVRELSYTDTFDVVELRRRFVLFLNSLNVESPSSITFTFLVIYYRTFQ